MSHVVVPWLAAGSGGQIVLFKSMLLFGGLLLVIAVGITVVMYLRRRLIKDRSDTDGGLTLEELRRLRDSGKLTIAEYEALRRRVVESVTKEAAGGSAR